MSLIQFYTKAQSDALGFNRVTTSADYTITTSDATTTFVCTNTITLTLPAATDAFWIAVYNAGTGYITVGTLFRLTPGEWARVASDGATFYVLDARLRYPLGDPYRIPAVSNVADDEWYGTTFDTAGTRTSGATPWAWRQQGTSSISLANDGLCVFTARADSTMTGIEQAAPSGTYRFRVPVTLTSGASTGTALVALYAFNSANSHMTQGGFITGSARVTGFFVDNYNSFTSYAISPKSPSTNDMVRAGGWLEFEYDGTNVIWRVSSTGQRGSFTTIYSVATSSHLAAAPTHIGLALFTDATAAATVGPWRRLA